MEHLDTMNTWLQCGVMPNGILGVAWALKDCRPYVAPRAARPSVHFPRSGRIRNIRFEPVSHTACMFLVLCSYFESWPISRGCLVSEPSHSVSLGSGWVAASYQCGEYQSGRIGHRYVAPRAARPSVHFPRSGKTTKE